MGVTLVNWGNKCIKVIMNVLKIVILLTAVWQKLPLEWQLTTVIILVTLICIISIWIILKVGLNFLKLLVEIKEQYYKLISKESSNCEES